MPDFIDPPYDDWPALFSASANAWPSRAASVAEDAVVRVRAELMECARAYSQHLERLADERGVKLAGSECLSDDVRQGVVMAGHQPVVFHPGIQLKAQLLTKLTRETGAIGIHVVIDTDVGDLSELTWPRVNGDGLRVCRASIAYSDSTEDGSSSRPILYASQRVKPREEIHAIFEEMQSDLASSGFCKEADRARQIGAIYEALSGCSLAAANTIARWSVEQRGYREVPLSVLVRETSLRQIVWALARDSRNLFHSYNECLDAYRSEHLIKNLANPFPNLRAEKDSYELPFWVVVGGERSALWSNDVDPARLPEGAYLATRGSITTLILRAYCSDLFIHGLGGGNYDRFVTTFAANYLKVELAPFVVASRTRVIQPEVVATLSAAVMRGKSIKEVVSQTERYLGMAIFSDDEEARLRDLLTKRLKLRQELLAAVSEEQRSSVAHALNQANRDVRDIVNNSALRNDVEGLQRNEIYLEQWSYREFPYFLFEND